MESGDNHTPSGRSARLFVGPDVLDPLFQELVARGISPYRARRQILEELQDGKRFIQIHVAEGGLTLEPQPLTEEEEQECRAALEKGGTRGYDTYYNILHDQAKPGGITEIAAPEAWGISLTVAIRDGHLLIDFLRLKYPPDSYSFALVNSEAVDEPALLQYTHRPPQEANSCRGFGKCVVLGCSKAFDKRWR